MSKIIGGQKAFLALRVQYGNLSDGIINYSLLDPVMSMPAPWSVTSRTSNMVFRNDVLEAIRDIAVRDEFELDSLLYYSSSGEYVYFIAIYSERRREFVQFQLGANTVCTLRFMPRGQAIVLEEGTLLLLSSAVGGAMGSQISQLALVDLNRGNVRPIYEASIPLARYVWHSQSQTLVAEFNDIHIDVFASTTPSTVVVFDATSGNIEHQFTVETPFIQKVLLSTDASFLCLGIFGSPSRSLDGTIRSHDVMVIDLFNGRVDQLTRILTLDPRNFHHLRVEAFYRDSYDLIISYGDRSSADLRFYQVNAAIGALVGELTFGSHNNGLNNNYSVSPDGEWIAFSEGSPQNQFSVPRLTTIYHIASQTEVMRIPYSPLEIQGMEWVESID